jgi:hypothetical protein
VCPDKSGLTGIPLRNRVTKKKKIFNFTTGGKPSAQDGVQLRKCGEIPDILKTTSKTSGPGARS